MFLVFSKEKIYSYIVALSTVAVLFGLSSFFMTKDKEEAVQTAANVQKELPIYCVETNEKKLSLTINCAWNADDIDQILKTLEKQNVKVTFFMVGDWVDKYEEAVKKISYAGHEIRKSFKQP